MNIQSSVFMINSTSEDLRKSIKHLSDTELTTFLKDASNQIQAFVMAISALENERDEQWAVNHPLDQDDALRFKREIRQINAAINLFQRNIKFLKEDSSFAGHEQAKRAIYTAKARSTYRSDVVRNIPSAVVDRFARMVAQPAKDLSNLSLGAMVELDIMARIAAKAEQAHVVDDDQLDNTYADDFQFIELRHDPEEGEEELETIFIEVQAEPDDFDWVSDSEL